MQPSREIDEIIRLNLELDDLRAATTAAISTLATENVELKTKLSPDIASIVDRLLLAGLEAWGEAATTSANPEDGVFRMIRDLESVARESPSWSQCDRIKKLFATACYHSGVVPTSEQASGMQAILDSGSSTGPIGEQWLSFRTWM